MMRVYRPLRAFLPFEPMALTTLDSLHSRLKSLPPQKGGEATCSLVHDSPYWFQSGVPFFISPKHDGVRMITFPPQLSGVRNQRTGGLERVKALGSTPKPKGEPHAETTTCFSRYGRPIFGMFWIEHELALLRALCRDPLLVLDGELYIHQNISGTPKSSPTDAAASPADDEKPLQSPRKTLRKRKGSASSILQDASPGAEPVATLPTPEGDSFKTGFLAVSALVHRLRGSRKNGPTAGGADASPTGSARLDEVLRHVNTLPRYCLFDVVSFNPSGAGREGGRKNRNLEEGRQKKNAMTGEVNNELQRILQLTLEAHCVADPEMLRCVPNLTPFSQRVRTLYFLTDLLSRGVSSPTLREAFGLTTPTAGEGAASGSHAGSKSSKGRKKRTGSGGIRGCENGGLYVQMVPYHLARSLDEAEHSLLPHYVGKGYEGVVIRTPTNLYEFREKRKDLLQSFVKPLLLQKPIDSKGAQSRQRVSCAGANSPPMRRTASVCRDIGDSERVVLLRTYTKDEVGKRHRRPTNHSYVLEKGEERDRSNTKSAATNGEEDAGDSSQQIAQRALERCKTLPKRCETCVKLLPFRDKEYAVLRPLLKVPSTNPRTRPLVAIPKKEVGSLKVRDEILNKSSACGEQGAVSRDDSTQGPCSDDEGMVVFYGLQCLAENGRVFNVSIPKMETEKQRALLEHLLEASRKRQGKRSLTGLYVTVKFASLTEHGIPRFATVKAIRGGKGWFL